MNDTNSRPWEEGSPKRRFGLKWKYTKAIYIYIYIQHQICFEQTRNISCVDSVSNQGWHIVFRIEEKNIVWGHFEEIEITCVNISSTQQYSEDRFSVHFRICNECISDMLHRTSFLGQTSFSSMLKVVLSAAPFRIQPYMNDINAYHRHIDDITIYSSSI